MCGMILSFNQRARTWSLHSVFTSAHIRLGILVQSHFMRGSAFVMGLERIFSEPLLTFTGAFSVSLEGTSVDKLLNATSRLRVPRFSDIEVDMGAMSAACVQTSGQRGVAYARVYGFVKARRDKWSAVCPKGCHTTQYAAAKTHTIFAFIRWGVWYCGAELTV